MNTEENSSYEELNSNYNASCATQSTSCANTINQEFVEICRLEHCYSLPTKATSHSAGFDLYAAIEKEIHIEPGKVMLIPAGFKLNLMPNFEAQVRPRSGLALKHSVTVLNSPGTVDPDYTGEVCVILINHGKENFIVTRGMRIAQMVIQKVLPISLKEIEKIENQSHNNRKSGGFGSTGI